MLRTIDYATLDDDTKGYLRAVRDANGVGSPGVFHPVSSGRPGCALLVGLIVLPLFVWAGYSSNKPAWANAMIQTAGVLLGGWLVLYAFRRWTASPDKYVGKFFYFDPDHVYVGEADQLKYAPLDEETTAEPVGQSSVRIETADGRFDVPLPNRAAAVHVANYYDALGHLREDESGRWAKLSSAELGAVAKYMVRNDRLPNGLEEVDLTIDRLPEEVRSKRGVSLGFLRYALILAVGVGVFLAFSATNGPIQDEANFAALGPDAGPSKLRDYLLNPSNKAHREEVTKRLSDLYDKPIAAVRANGTDPEIREGFVKLLDTLRGPETPAVSIAVTDTGGGMAGWGDSLRVRLADGIGGVVGKEFIVFVKAPGGELVPDASAPATTDGQKYPHVNVKYTTADPTKLTWTIELRLKPDDATPYLTAVRTNNLMTVNPNGVPLSAGEAVYADLMAKMVGSAPAAPPPLPADDW